MADMLSQDEIDELLNGNISTQNGSGDKQQSELSAHEIEALNEISNISTTDCANVLFKLVGRKCSFNMPKIEIVEWDNLRQSIISDYGEQNCMSAVLEYTEGLTGFNVFILKLRDAGVIADLMMSGEGQNIPEELTDLQISAVNEAISQIAGSSAASMSSMLSKTIRIASHRISLLKLDNFNASDFFEQQEKLVKIIFKLDIEGLIDSAAIQIIPVSFAKLLVENLINTENVDNEIAGDVHKADFDSSQDDGLSRRTQAEFERDMQAHSADSDAAAEVDEQYDAHDSTNRKDQNVSSAKQKAATKTYSQQKLQVNVQPAQFQTFEDGKIPIEKENMELIRDIPLLVTVELGRTQKLIRHILEFGQGTIIELDKLAGEPVDILVNGKFIAKGEVVVIDENFGVRITDIIHPSKRI